VNSRASCSNFILLADFAHSSHSSSTDLPRTATSPRPNAPNTSWTPATMAPSDMASSSHSHPVHRRCPAFACDRPRNSPPPCPHAHSFPDDARSCSPHYFAYLPSTHPGLNDRPGTCGSLSDRVRCTCANCTAVIPSLESPGCRTNLNDPRDRVMDQASGIARYCSCSRG
jgi:hypothetical protein